MCTSAWDISDRGGSLTHLDAAYAPGTCSDQQTDTWGSSLSYICELRGCRVACCKGKGWVSFHTSQGTSSGMVVTWVSWGWGAAGQGHVPSCSGTWVCFPPCTRHAMCELPVQRSEPVMVPQMRVEKEMCFRGTLLLSGWFFFSLRL